MNAFVSLFIILLGYELVFLSSNQLLITLLIELVSFYLINALTYNTRLEKRFVECVCLLIASVALVHSIVAQSLLVGRQLLRGVDGCNVFL